MILVVDASVALKWFFRAPGEEEEHTERATAILAGIDDDRVRMLQPPHFLAEVAAVLARRKPDDARDDLTALQALDWEVVEEPDVYTAALALTARLEHHLFDTLYHAVALETPDATLVTADRRYYERARDEGAITLLRDLELPPPTA